ncbi:MAG: peptidylprolyl isomerase [Myxococcales bacterium]|nr:peptidylprolyl isomerase [Myxococcales bacterium]MCB9541510.1 peptidylprolyl isomerase [Myxococcales bacterium]MCB9554132.1 peptidylprolyl isomerase [Myxococcales bacterium]
MLALALAVAGCKGETKTEPKPEAEEAAAPAADAPAAGVAAQNPILRDPSKATEQAPEQYTVELDTTAGPIRIDVTRAWAPRGADRFYNLVRAGYYDDVAFFRVIPGFMAQVGLHGEPEINKIWREARIEDDPVRASNTRGMVSFATAGPNTRTTQFFINFGDNNNLDGMGFSPFGKVQDASMATVDALHGGYGEGAPRGKGPMQGRIQAEGNAYLKRDFPELSYIKSARIAGE